MLQHRGPKKHAKRKKVADTKNYLLYYSIYIKYRAKANLQGQKAYILVVWGWEWEHWLKSSTKDLSKVIEEVLKLDCGDVAQL